MEVTSERQGDVLLPGTASGLELEYPARIVPFPSWLGHTPFALWLIGALKPRIFVELGVHTGNSYCAFLQAVHAHGLATRCFGIDHWQGDEHAGHYGDEVYEELKAYHDPRYGTFSTLVRTSFEEAAAYFSDASIDLLHIDGFHTYEAVSADFRSWLPKVSPRAVALFHDINVRERGFGIWKLWEELTSRYPHFEFLHSHGLGIVYLGSEPLTGPLEALFGLETAAQRERVQSYFSRLGTSVVDRLATRTLAAEIEAMKTKPEKTEARKARIRTLESELSMAQGSLEQAKAESAARKVGLSTLETELSTAQSNLERAKAESEARNARIGTLEAELSTAQASLEQANAETEARTRELEAATLQVRIKASMLQQRLMLTARLQRELLAANREKNSCQRQLNDLLQSTSWRLTRPLRFAVNELRRLLAEPPRSGVSSGAAATRS